MCGGGSTHRHAPAHKHPPSAVDLQLLQQATKQHAGACAPRISSEDQVITAGAPLPAVQSRFGWAQHQLGTPSPPKKDTMQAESERQMR